MAKRTQRVVNTPTRSRANLKIGLEPEVWQGLDLALVKWALKAGQLELELVHRAPTADWLHLL